MSSSPWTVESLEVYGGSVKEGDLRMTANRYTPRESFPDGLTLLFAHCLGSHKELWEPILDKLFQAHMGWERRHRIREAISFDMPTHGDAALLNEHILKNRTELFSSYIWADAIEAFVKSHLQSHRLAGIGHSAGAGTLVLVASRFARGSQPFAALIIIEPAMVSHRVYNEQIDSIQATWGLIGRGTLARKSAWPNKAAAHAVMRKRLPWALWDPRVFELHLRYGYYEGRDESGKTVLKCKTDKRQEAMGYPDWRPHVEAAERLTDLCKDVPVHLVWGERLEFTSPEINDSVSDASEGRKLAGVITIEEAGHLVVLDKPDAVASTIITCLTGDQAAPNAKL